MPIAPKAKVFTLGYLGTLSSPGYIETLRVVSNALAVMGGQLNVYGPMTAPELHAMGLHHASVSIRGLIPSNELIHKVREECHALVIPLSFRAEEKSAISINFPSKLTDCTATALPLFVVGPSFATAVRWVRENPGSALVVERLDLDEVRHSLAKLCSDQSLRTSLGETASKAGSAQFSADAAQRIFHKHLRHPT